MDQRITRSVSSNCYKIAMQRSFLLKVSIASSILANAQTWCPPGATWTFGSDAFGYYGFQQYSYVGDTVTGGLPGQRIDAFTGSSNFFNSDQTFNHIPAAMITGLHGDVVSIWSNIAQAWDTLFWLGAAPGDTIHRPFAEDEPCSPPDRFIVQDTSILEIDGVPLKRWTLLRSWIDEFPTGPIHYTERLGWDYDLIPFPVCMAVDGPAGMRCYSDVDVDVSFFPYGCTTLVGMNETHRPHAMHLFPNPGNDQFIIQLPVGDHHISLIDASGSTVLQQSTTEQQPVVNTTAVQAGTYFIKVRDDKGNLRTGSWVKLP